ncbi:ATP-binding protein [Bacteroides xylanisolvens]|uniref:ATP-binding protein n=1 Tax=Bacteroides xylanisolvens TaxID=371601 RepID=UPI001CDC1A0C|nr:ATP-binding protein [Bacteroides xylanisolvens]MCA4455987.1 ATP-binding protein [Bacteroides xylanisolvens]MCA4460698.1 ATP-binding protein [Bacteroides xylanisolvens]MCA4474289.1 ATP-binding protein [Bacteroides xylanisolvens]MCA4483533.1 ATP-binding protein [Bacteroides xylanisolvens]
MNQPVKRKRIPYGMMNFIDVREDDCYYVDKTHYIPLIENANKYFFYIRPRRFGKSLTISMLHHYYNILEADKFEKWYGDLYIGKHPTPERNSYLIIYLNFAVVNAELNSYRQSLDAHCNTEFNFFCDVYAQYLPEGIKEEMNKKKGAIEQLDYLYKECIKTNQQIYLFIDEYDHFTNKILSEPSCLEDYKSETYGTSYLRSFFDTVKAGTDSTIKRCFVTGVSPVTMDDLTSGFNIGTNYSLSPEFNEMTGFNEEEVRAMLDYYATTCQFHHSTDGLIEAMKPWYDNYCFAEQSYGGTTMYNSNMVLYFVDNYIRNGGYMPRNMVEENIRVDYNKLRMLIRKDKEFAHDASTIQTLVQQGYITGELKTGFPAETIAEPDNFISLLFYFGMLTISGTKRGKTLLTIPNQVVREQLYSYLLDTYNEADLRFDNWEKGKLASAMAYRGDWKAYFDYIAECLHRYSSQRDKQKGEAYVHGFTLAMTAQNRFYRPISEQENQEGYADIFMFPLLDIYKDMLHSYIIELKYVKGKDSDEKVEQLRQEAITQANRYAASETVQKAIGTTTLHKIIVVYQGMKMVVCEEV